MRIVRPLFLRLLPDSNFRAWPISLKCRTVFLPSVAPVSARFNGTGAEGRVRASFGSNASRESVMRVPSDLRLRATTEKRERRKENNGEKKGKGQGGTVLITRGGRCLSTASCGLYIGEVAAGLRESSLIKTR